MYLPYPAIIHIEQNGNKTPVTGRIIISKQYCSQVNYATAKIKLWQLLRFELILYTIYSIIELDYAVSGQSQRLSWTLLT